MTRKRARRIARKGGAIIDRRDHGTGPGGIGQPKFKPKGHGHGGGGGDGGGGKKRRRRRRRQDSTPAITYDALTVGKLGKIASRLLAPQRREYMRLAKLREGGSGAVADVYAEGAERTQDAYEAASEFTGAAAEGFSEGLRQRALDDPVTGAIADTTYGTTGYIPATGLAREGAALTAAAARMPGTSRARGAMEASGIRAAGAAEVAKQRAALLQHLLDREIQKRSISTQEGYLGIAGRKQLFDEQMGRKQHRLDVRQQRHDEIEDARDHAEARQPDGERAEFFQEQADKALSLALGWGDGFDRPEPEEAYRRLFSTFGKRLKGKRYDTYRIRRMLRNTLLTVGYAPADLKFIDITPPVRGEGHAPDKPGPGGD